MDLIHVHDTYYLPKQNKFYKIKKTGPVYE